jgi:hypothetical protein
LQVRVVRKVSNCISHFSQDQGKEDLSVWLWVVIVNLLNIVALRGLGASAIATAYYTFRRAMKFVCAANLRLVRRKPRRHSTDNNSGMGARAGKFLTTVWQFE